MEINEIKNRLIEIRQESQILEEKWRECIVNAITDVSKENYHKIHKISEHIYIIKHSELIGNPWSVSFYNLEESAKVVLKFLSNKDVTKWKKLLEEKLEKCDSNKVEFEECRVNRYGHKVTYKIPINKIFIEKIVEKI